MARVAVAPRRNLRGLNGTGRVVRAAFEVLELTDALTRVYASDAHLVTYVVPGASRQPRIDKTGLGEAPATPLVEAFFADEDNPGHAPWTAATLANAVANEPSIAPLATAGVYYTAHGRRSELRGRVDALGGIRKTAAALGGRASRRSCGT